MIRQARAQCRRRARRRDPAPSRRRTARDAHQRAHVAERSRARAAASSPSNSSATCSGRCSLCALAHRLRQTRRPGRRRSDSMRTLRRCARASGTAVELGRAQSPLGRAAELRPPAADAAAAAAAPPSRARRASACDAVVRSGLDRHCRADRRAIARADPQPRAACSARSDDPSSALHRRIDASASTRSRPRSCVVTSIWRSSSRLSGRSRVARRASIAPRPLKRAKGSPSAGPERAVVQELSGRPAESPRAAALMRRSRLLEIGECRQSRRRRAGRRRSPRSRGCACPRCETRHPPRRRVAGAQPG